MRRSFIPLAVLLLALGAAAPPALGAEEAKSGWYVLRDRTSGDCWTGRLITIAGQLASARNQVAGGPFESEEAAEAHRSTLVERGTCAED